MDKRKIKELIVEHKERAISVESFIPRNAALDAQKYFRQKEIHIITGVRRCGKSTLMRLLMNKLLVEEKVKKENILYLNFEDDRFLEFGYNDFQTLYEAFLEIESPEGKKYFFLDEIQNVMGWQRWVNRLYEFEEIKVFITGSSASMLSGEVATALTGRNRMIELYPFSFNEFLEANGLIIKEKDILMGEKRARANKLFNDYMEIGGFPEVVKTKDTSILQNYFKDIIYRDVIARYAIKNVREIKELALFLASNLSCTSSYKRLKDVIDVNSLTTVKNYIGYLQDVYLFFAIDLFDYSLKRQIYNPSKVYCVDHALAASIAFRFSADTGRTMENMVFLELKRRGHEIYYWKSRSGKEVDFLIKEGRKIKEAIQVSYDINEKTTYDREISGAVASAKEFGMRGVTVISADKEGEDRFNDVKIRYIPIWQWLTGIGSS